MFGTVATTLLAFIVAISLLVAIHEFGHFYVARRLGVKVLRFSVGFGRPLLRRVGQDGTEYVLAAIPLGGYVKMLDEREGQVAEHERHRAFNRQPVSARVAIVAAGPLINLVFAVFAFWLMFVVGVQEAKPLIGDPTGIAAESGLRYGDEIVRIDGEAVSTWTESLLAMVGKASTQRDALTSVRGEDGLERELTLKLSRLPSDLKESELLNELGLSQWDIRIPAEVGAFAVDSPADAAGLRVGDVITSVESTPIRFWTDIRPAIQLAAKNDGSTLKISYSRDGQAREVLVTPRIDSSSGARAFILGIQPPALTAEQIELRQRAITTFQYGPIDAIGRAFKATYSYTAVTLETLWLMVTGDASASNVSGPITIAQVAKSSADAGFAPFMRFLGLVSLSLGIFNLLPIPILDGGHLLYYLIESVKGSPVSERMQLAGQYIGTLALLSLMVLAFHNDLARIFWS